MIHEAYMPVYIGSRFSLRTYVRVGPPEVVQEALADLKKHTSKGNPSVHENQSMHIIVSPFCTQFNHD